MCAQPGKSGSICSSLRLPVAPKGFRGSPALDTCCLDRPFKNRALVFGQHCGLIDRPMVMELSPRATHLDEPSGRTNPKLKPTGGSFAQAFFTSHEEVIVIVTLR